MKGIHKLVGIVCATVFATGMTTSAGAVEGIGHLPPQGAKAYLERIQSAQKLSGAAYIHPISQYDQLWEGVCLAKLIDFDGDSIPELYYVEKPAGGTYTQRLYTYHDGQTVLLPIPARVSNFSTDVSPTTLFYIGQDKAYLVDGMEVIAGGEANYLTKKGDTVVSDLVYRSDMWGEAPSTANGKVVTREELDAQCKALTDGMMEVTYSFWASHNARLGDTVTQTIQQLRTLTNPTAELSTDKLIVDDKSVALPVYKIAGSNYYMLRGLAQALSGTEAQFAVGWDAARSQITLTKGEPYTPAGNEKGEALATKAAASLTSSSVWLDGQPLSLTVYNIEGNNFFKLRDLGQALNFSIGWNEGQHTISIDTAQPYAK